MSYFFKNFISLLLIISLMLVSLPFCTAKTAEAPAPAYFDLPVKMKTVKVGLTFDKTAVEAAELENSVGQGFYLGYFDYTRCFHELAETCATAITLRADTGFIVNKDDLENEIGAWHILLSQSFEDYPSAQNEAEKYADGFTGFIDGKYRVLLGAFSDEAGANVYIKEHDLDAEAYTGGENSVLCSDDDTIKLVFLIENGKNTKLALRPISDEKAETWFGGNLYYGDFEVFRTGDKLSVVSYISLEDYVKGVLPYEMIASWPPEALKAQGACARTYVMNYINGYSELGFDVRNDTYSQVYKGKTGTVEASNSAAEATSGQYVRYRGALCKIYYMSSDGGATDSSANVFSQRRAYLSGIIDHNEDEIEFYNKTWKAVLREATVLRRLGNNGYEIGDVADIKAEKSENGIVIKLIISDSDGKKVTLLGDDCFLVLSLNSLNYDVFSEDDGLWTFSGKGWGHNCGMSQWGAYAMAKNDGALCTDIIDYYFSGAYIR